MALVFLFLGLAVVGLAMNAGLIGLAVRAKHVAREMWLVVGLAAVDMVLPLFTIASVAYHTASGQAIDSVPHACAIEGTVDFVTVFLSMLLVAAIALVRLSHVLRRAIPLALKLALASSAGGFVGLCVVCGVRGEFRVLESNIYCAPVGATSGVSMAVLVLHSLSLLVFLAITLGCYAKIIVALVAASRDFDAVGSCGSLQLDLAVTPAQRWRARRPGVIRTAVIGLSYLTIVLPPSVLMLLEAMLPTALSKALNTPIDLFIVSISILNPSLVLFAHSAIFRELALAVRSLARSSEQ